MRLLARRSALLLVFVLLASVASLPTVSAATRNAKAPPAGMTLLGTWTTHFTRSNLNGFGANIIIPAQRINGKVVKPGQRFDFISGAGPFTSPPYKLGGALRNGRIRDNAVLGGGMCSASTTLFNAAMRAGLTIVERHPHSLYISRYPVGLDATVWGTPRRGQNVVFVNDTGHDILIRGLSGRGKVTFEIWGTDDGRTVEITQPRVENQVDGQMYFEYTDELDAGQRQKVNDNYNSFESWVTRKVHAQDGSVIHSDTWHSKYKLLNGLTLVGRYPGDPPAGTRIRADDYPHPVH